MRPSTRKLIELVLGAILITSAVAKLVYPVPFMLALRGAFPNGVLSEFLLRLVPLLEMYVGTALVLDPKVPAVDIHLATGLFFSFLLFHALSATQLIGVRDCGCLPGIIGDTGSLVLALLGFSLGMLRLSSKTFHAKFPSASDVRP